MEPRYIWEDCGFMFGQDQETSPEPEEKPEEEEHIIEQDEEEE